MKKLVLNIPDSIDVDEKDALLMISSKLYQKGELSLGQAADLAGYSKRAFMEILSKYDVSIINHPPSDLDRDLENAKRYNI